MADRFKISIREFNSNKLNYKCNSEKTTNNNSCVKIHVEKDNKQVPLFINLKTNNCFMSDNNKFKKLQFNIKVEEDDVKRIDELMSDLTNIAWNYKNDLFRYPPSDKLLLEIKNPVFESKDKKTSKMSLKVFKNSIFITEEILNGERTKKQLKLEEIKDKLFNGIVIFKVDSIIKINETLYPQLSISSVLVKEIVNTSTINNTWEMDDFDDEY